jgi:dynein heavy chain 2
MVLVNTIQDEVHFWKEASFDKSKTRLEIERAQYLHDSLGQLGDDFGKLTYMNLIALLEVIEKTHDVLDAVWRQQEYDAYPQERMAHILGLVSEDIVGCVQQQLSHLNLMGDPLLKVLEPLRGSIQVCDNLLSTFDTLTAKIWPNSMTNKWKGEPFTDRNLTQLAVRMTSILDIRTSHDLLLQLLSVEDQKELNVKRAFQPFESTNQLSCSAFAEMRWKDAEDRYSENLVGIEKRAVLKLREILGTLHSQPSQLLKEFQRYQDIIKRKAIEVELGVI